METAATQLLQSALALPEAARADLAAQLLASLDPTIDVDWDAAWSDEIKQRIDMLDSGTVQAVPWHEARARITGE